MSFKFNYKWDMPFRKNTSKYETRATIVNKDKESVSKYHINQWDSTFMPSNNDYKSWS